MQHFTKAAMNVAKRGMATKSFNVSVAQLLGARTRQFESVTPTTPVVDAVERMTMKNVGSLVVLKENQLYGILTERDVLNSVHHLMKEPTLEVEKICSPNPVTVKATATVGDCLALMGEEHHRFRHLPVTDEGELVGVLSIRDLCDSLMCSHKNEVAELSTQVSKLATVIGADLTRISAVRSRNWTTRLRAMME